MFRQTVILAYVIVIIFAVVPLANAQDPDIIMPVVEPIIIAPGPEAEGMLAAMQSMLGALNAHDVAEMSLYWADDIVYDFVAQPPPMEGKEQVAAFFGGLLQGVPDIHSTQTHPLGEKDL